MPKDKDRKRLVRRRMAITGERYTEALQSLTAQASKGADPRRAGQPPEPEPPDAELRPLIALLGSRQGNERAYALLRALPPARLRPLAIDGLQSDNPAIRRRCCRLLDDLSVTPESLAALTAALDDPEPTVRVAALHSLTCVDCKPDACSVDERGLLERCVRDPSPVVRRAVVGPMEWRGDLVAPWVAALLGGAADDPDPKVRSSAAKGLARIRDQSERDAAWRRLPEPLRSTVARHAGKWVVVSGGRVVSAHPSRGQTAKQARGVRHTRRTDPGLGLDGADLYWVAPPDGEPANGPTEHAPQNG